MTDDEVLKQALAELGDVVRCHCDEAFRDRGLQDPQCQCDSMDAVRTVIARIAWLEREREELATKLDAVISGDWSKAKLVRFENGQFDFSGGPVAFIAEYLSQVMEADDGYHNNLEVRVSHPKAGPMVLTLQRVWGETPAEQRKKAVARAEAAEATVATLTEKMEAMRGAAEEAAEVIHKAYVSATMEAVNAGPSHPLKDNIDKWRVRCLRAEEALRAALTTEKTND